VLLDPRQATAWKFGVRGHPVTFIIGPGGKIWGEAIGYRNWIGANALALVTDLVADD